MSVTSLIVSSFVVGLASPLIALAALARAAWGALRERFGPRPL